MKDGPIRKLNVGTLTVCESFLEGQMTKRPFSIKGKRSKEPLQLAHSDDCGPLSDKLEVVMNISSTSLTIIQDTVMFT